MKNNPHVVLRPLLRDTGDLKYCFSSLPACASMFNRPEMSDVKLLVGDLTLFAHRNILSAASEVFASMFNGNWVESTNSQPAIELHEDVDCIKHFENFLYFIYSGTISLNNSNVVPLFLLSDKYDIKPLYNECFKVIETGLKVFVVQNGTPSHSYRHTQSNDMSNGSFQNPLEFQLEMASHPGFFAPNEFASSPNDKPSIIPSESFSVGTLLKLLRLCHDQQIYQAALFNLEARMGNQIIREKYDDNWNNLAADVIVEMLSDDRFCYDEYALFKAVIAWIQHSPDRSNPETVDKVLLPIRYSLFKTPFLYAVTKNPYVQNSSKINEKVTEAIKYQLFRPYFTWEESQTWSTPSFTPRTIVHC